MRPALMAVLATSDMHASGSGEPNRQSNILVKAAATMLSVIGRVSHFASSRHDNSRPAISCR